MSVQIIKGRSGSGKTYLLYNDLIKEAVNNKDRLCLVIVPEQFTLATQKLLTQMHPQKALLNIDILSFDRLALRILQESAKAELPLLDDTSKNFIIRHILENLKDDLKILGKYPDRAGFVDEIKSFITEAEQYALSPDDFKNYAAKESVSDALSIKLTDISLIYGAYRDFLEGKYISAQSRLHVAANAACSSKILKDAYVTFDGFTGFTPIQCELLRAVIKLSRKARFTLTIDPDINIFNEGDKNDLFYLSKKTGRTVYNLADECDVPVENDIKIYGQNGRFSRSGELSHLEKNIFNRKAERLPAGGKEAALWILCAPSLKDEITHCAKTIRMLVRDKGYKYKDIAIVTGDVASYGLKAKSIFADYDIPLFVDETETISNERFVRCIRSIINLLNDDFSYRYVFSFLKSGYLNLEREDIDILENYCLARNISGWKKWEKNFEDDRAEAVRKNVVEILAPLKEFKSKRGKTARDITVFIYDFISSSGVKNSVVNDVSAMDEALDEAAAQRQLKVYEAVMKLFEKIVAFNGDDRISPKEYAALYEAGMKGATLGKVPASANEVLLGDVERTRLSDVKVLFVLGTNEGVLPSGLQEGGILSEQERKLITDSGLEIAQTQRDRMLSRDFYLYLSLTKPSERLYISYASCDALGESLKSSYVVDSVLNLFKDLKTEYIKPLSETLSYESQKGILPWFDTQFRNAVYADRISEEFLKLYGYIKNNKEFAPVISGIERSFARKYNVEDIGQESAKSLYTDVSEFSITRLESFASCEFSHFLKYGLKLKERDIYEFTPADLGNIYHDAASFFMEGAIGAGKKIHDLTPADIELMAQSSIDEILKKDTYASYLAGASGEYMKKRMGRVFLRTADTASYQIKEGLFEPVWCEHPFNIPMKGEGDLRLYGRIDRTDLAKMDDKNLVRVIDYKSSSRKLNLDKIYAGTDIQLMIYLSAALSEISRKYPGVPAYPSGAYYYAMKDPVAKGVEPESENAGDKIREEIRKELRLSGISSTDDDSIAAIDTAASLRKKKSSDVVPFMINADGSVRQSSSVVSLSGLKSLTDDAMNVAYDNARSMLLGHNKISPLREDKKRDACRYCPYSSVCGFDPAGEYHSYRELSDVAQSVRERLGSEV